MNTNYIQQTQQHVQVMLTRGVADTLQNSGKQWYTTTTQEMETYVILFIERKGASGIL